MKGWGWVLLAVAAVGAGFLVMFLFRGKAHADARTGMGPKEDWQTEEDRAYKEYAEHCIANVPGCKKAADKVFSGKSVLGSMWELANQKGRPPIQTPERTLNSLGSILNRAVTTINAENRFQAEVSGGGSVLGAAARFANTPGVTLPTPPPVMKRPPCRAIMGPGTKGCS